MRAISMVLLLAAGTAEAQSIYPAGGPVPHTPTLWISADHMPRIEVTNESGPVMFEIDESQVERGPRRIALRPQVGDGPFTVVLDGRPIRFQGDAGLARDDAEYTNSRFTRVAIERVRGRDTLVIDALTEPQTTLYFLNHSSPRHDDLHVFARYVWSGPGRVLTPGITDDNLWKNGTKRFEVPLDDFGVSCASTATVEVSPYTTHVSASTTLHPIATLDVAAGKVRLPLELFGEVADRAALPWLPCAGAAAVAPPEEVAEPEPTPPTTGVMSEVGYAGTLDRISLRDVELGAWPFDHQLEQLEHRLALPPALTPSADGNSGDDTELVWWSAPLVLVGIALAMWRATGRAAA